MTTTNATVQVDDRYQGVEGLALGGITGGLLARQIGTEVAVTLHRPVPTGEPLERRSTDEAVELWLDDELVASARAATVDVEVPTPVSWDDAVAASRAFLGRHVHPYPSCFACGTERPQGDGLRLFAGPVEGGSDTTGDGPLVAAPWTPGENHAASDGTIPQEYIWAALDCPSIWAVVEAAPPDSADHVVTGRLAVRIDEPIRAGEPHVVVAWPESQRPGRRPAAAAILDETGVVKACVRHTLVVVDWGVPLGMTRGDDRG